MPVRAVMNVAYAHLMKGRDAKEREEFDTNLHGWAELNARAGRRLLSGGIDDDEGGGQG